MKHYQDITLLPDAEASLGFLWHKVYQKIHLALVENKITENHSAVAISFPGYGTKQYPLGDKLRLFADSQAQLEKLDINQWLSRLTDYCHIKSIQSVPNVSKYVCFRRKHVKSALKKTGNLASHLNKSFEEVLKFRKENDLYHDCQLPFIHLVSQDKDEHKKGEINRFRLFIEQSFHDSPQQGVFNCYGLSKTATVPWF